MSANNSKSSGQECQIPAKEESSTIFSQEDIQRFEAKAAKHVERFAMLLYFRLVSEIDIALCNDAER